MTDPTEPLSVPELRLRLLGVAAWSLDGRRWHALSVKDAALLARLALDGRQARSAMAEWLWPEVPLPRAHANLRQRLFRLRQASGRLVDEGGDSLCIAPAVALDLDSPDADFDAPLLAQAPDPGPAVQSWIDEARRRWLARRADRMTGLAARHEAAGAIAAALALTERLLALEPLLEHAWRRLMRLHMLRGDRAAAVAAFERCERVLRDELGLRPAPETQALLARVEALIEPVRPPPASVEPGSDLPASLLHPPQRIGREGEWRALLAAWRDAPGFVIECESGLGGTRLLADFAAAQPRTLMVSAHPGDASVPYALVLRALRRWASAGRPDATADGVAGAGGIALAADADRDPGSDFWPTGPERQELARLLPELGPPPAAPGLQALLHSALLSTFERVAAAGWAGLLVDDLHLADAASAGVLLAAATTFATRPATVDTAPSASTPRLRWGFTLRRGSLSPEPAQTLAQALDRGLVRVTLAPLDVAAATALVQSLGLPGADASLAARLVRHCGGHPAFLLETLRHLVLDPAAAQRATLPLPARVESAYAHRLARLSPPAMALLRVAALAGGEASAALIADVLGQPLVALADAWHECEAAQMLYADGLPHEALRDTVLAGLPQALRAALHERVAHALQGRGQPAAAVARHFVAAGLHEAAGAALQRAAADAGRVGRSAECLAAWAEAARAYDAADRPEAAFEARLAAIPTLLGVDGPEAALGAVDQLAPSARTSSQRTRLALERANVALAGYRAREAREAAIAALAEAEPEGLDALRGRLIDLAARGLLGDVSGVLADLPALAPRLDGVQDPVLAAVLWSHWAVALHCAGRMRECRAALVRQRDLARAAGHAQLEAEALSSLSGLHSYAGDSDLACQSGIAAAALLRRVGNEQAALVADVNLALGLVGRDEMVPAIALLDRIAPEAQPLVGADVARIATEIRVEGWWRIGDFERAGRILGAPPPAEAPLTRRVSHVLNTALIDQACGRLDAAVAGWQALDHMLRGTQGVGLALRGQALASVVRPVQDALDLLDTLVRRASEGASLPAEGVARLRRAAVLHRSGRVESALTDARWLRAHASHLRHLYVPGGEWRALVVQVLQDAGAIDEARTARDEAQAWFREVVAPQLPPGGAALWRRHPAYGDGVVDWGG